MTTQSTRLSVNAGIAIGPILFVVAILAVLVGALAAGSGGFGSSTANDSNRINGSTLIEQGTNLKTGMDRIMVNGALTTDVVFSQTYTTTNAANALFSPSGGGLTFQNPPPLVVDATVNTWRYVNAATIPGIGTAANQVVVAAQVRNLALCQAINGIIFGKTSTQATTPPAYSTAATSTNLLITNDMTTTCSDTNLTSVAAGCAIASNKMDMTLVTTNGGISGRTQACISDGGTTPKYYYYQLMYSS